MMQSPVCSSPACWAVRAQDTAATPNPESLIQEIASADSKVCSQHRHGAWSYCALYGTQALHSSQRKQINLQTCSTNQLAVGPLCRWSAW